MMNEFIHWLCINSSTILSTKDNKNLFESFISQNTSQKKNNPFQNHNYQNHTHINTTHYYKTFLWKINTITHQWVSAKKERRPGEVRENFNHVTHLNTHFVVRTTNSDHLFVSLKRNNSSWMWILNSRYALKHRYSVHESRSEFITCICTYETIILHNIKKKLSWTE